MNQATIEWVRGPDGKSPGFTVSPITGCLGPDGHRCSYCFAETLANGRVKTRYLANSILPSHNEQDHEAHHTDPFWPRLWPSRFAEIERRKKPAGIFLYDMGEWAGPWVPDEWRRQMFQTIHNCPRHLFYLLSKQYAQVPKFGPYPDHCRIGMSVTNTAQYMEAVRYLPEVAAAHKFISFEPLLESIFVTARDFRLMEIDQVIVGAQSKPKKLPMVEWVTRIIRQADDTGLAGIKVFLKNSLYDVLPDASGDLESLTDRPCWVTKASGGYELRQEVPLESRI